MNHLLKIAIIILCMNILIDIAVAQEEVDGATIKGQVIEAGPEKNPIPGVRVTIVNYSNSNEYTVHTNDKGEFEHTSLPEGRYTLSYSKDGYGDRVGKSKVVAAGGEIFTKIIMRKKSSLRLRLMPFYINYLLTGLPIILTFIGVLAIAVLLIRNSRV